MGKLTAGAARLCITPPVGIRMAGFAARPGPSIGIHEDLFAKALYLSNGDAAVILVTADIIGLDFDQVARVRELVRDELDLPPEAVTVTCSHTHSGPRTYSRDTEAPLERAYTELMLRKVASAAILAARAAGPATLGWSREAVCVHCNRRERTPQGIILGYNPDGITLPWVDVLSVNRPDGEPLARWFCHAAHGVTLGQDSVLISADWMGYAQRTIEAVDPGVTALFAQGCCGNLNSHPRGTFEIAEAQGRAVAGAVLKAAALAEHGDDVALAYATSSVELPLQDAPPVEETARILEEARAVQQAETEDTPEHRRSINAHAVRWAEGLHDLAQRGVTGLTTPFGLHALRVGDTAVVGLSGEVFAEYAVNIAGRSPAAHTVVTAYSNGQIGYLPTAEAFPEGGYEVAQAYRYARPTMLHPDCEGVVLDAAESLVGRLFA